MAATGPVRALPRRGLLREVPRASLKRAGADGEGFDSFPLRHGKK